MVVRRWLPLVFLGGVVFVLAQEGQKKEATPAVGPELKTLGDRASYSYGFNIGRSIKSQGADVNVEQLLRGLKDSLGDAKPLLSEPEMREAVTSFQKETQAKKGERDKVQGEKNKKDGEEFLAKNRTNPDVKVTTSGLQYKVVKEGTGNKPVPTDNVTVHYRGTLIDGTEFDSSYSRGEPAKFQLNRVIKGWTEGLQLMSVGAKYQFFIPSDMAYGPQATGPKIGPHSTLIFDVELISIP